MNIPAVTLEGKPMTLRVRRVDGRVEIAIVGPRSAERRVYVTRADVSAALRAAVAGWRS